MPANQPAEIGALDVVEERAAKGEISPTVARKILDDNRGGSTGYRSTSPTSTIRRSRFRDFK
jgi:hypothetical protein